MSRESLEVSPLDSLFEDVEPVIGVEATRTIIGEIDEDRWVRIKRVSQWILDQESEHRKYPVDLALPHDIHEENIIVYSSLWAVSPQAAAEPEVAAESKPAEQCVVYNPWTSPEQPVILTPEDIFKWYDAQPEEKKISLDITPDISPNIYTVEGMEELIKLASFREVRADG